MEGYGLFSCLPYDFRLWLFQRLQYGTLSLLERTSKTLYTYIVNVVLPHTRSNLKQFVAGHKEIFRQDIINRNPPSLAVCDECKEPIILGIMTLTIYNFNPLPDSKNTLIDDMIFCHACVLLNELTIDNLLMKR